MNLEDTSTTVFATISGGRHRKARKTGVSRVPTLCNCRRGSPGGQARGFAGKSLLRHPYDCYNFDYNRGAASTEVLQVIEFRGSRPDNYGRPPALAAEGRPSQSRPRAPGQSRAALCHPATVAECQRASLVLQRSPDPRLLSKTDPGVYPYR